MGEARPKISGLMVRILKGSTRLVLISQVLSGVAFPIIEFILALQTQVTLPNWAWGIVFFTHLLFGIHAAWAGDLVGKIAALGLEFNAQGQLDLVRSELSVASTGNLGLAASLETLAKRSSTVLGAIAILQEVLANHSLPAAPQGVEAVLAPLVQNRAEVLGYSGSDKYNFCVYLFDRSTQLLTVYYRDCDNRIPQRNRTWRMGMGHVGITFAKRVTIVSEDVEQAGELVDTSVETDPENYVSFISAPIFNVSASNEQDPLGVLVVTSSRAYHLAQEHQVFVDSFASLLSVYFTVKSKLEKPA